MKSNIIRDKSFQFAIRIIKLFKYLKEKNEFVLSKQILKSGTSIGANIEESIGGQSKNDFISKISIAYKEARETRYRILLLFEGGYIDTSMRDSLLVDINTILKIITRIQKTLKSSN